MRMPDFLVLGAAKAGTSALYRQLEQHPEIYTSPVKEPHFFAFENSPPDFRGPHGRDPAMRRLAVTELDDYRRLFEGAAEHQRAGEASTHYLYLPASAPNIRRHLPDARLIAILRDPVERAYSAYLHLRRDGREPLADFGAALAAEDERVADNWSPGYHYRRGGCYAAHLRRFFELFPAERIGIYLYDDFRSDPARLLADIFRFLGVDPGQRIDASRRYNVSGVHRNRLARGLYLLSRSHRARRLVAPLLPKRWRSGLRERIVLPWHRRSLVKPPLPAAARALLIDAYRDDVRDLEEMTGRDLSAWLRPAARP